MSCHHSTVTSKFSSARGYRMNELRERLRDITENGRPDSHPPLIDELRRIHPHSIEIIEPAAPIERYTCAMYALDLVENDEYAGIVLASPKPIYASTAFVQRLIDRGTLVPLTQPKSDALVVYRLRGSVTHIGRMLSATRVESKWGIGHLYRHALLEVPMQYGDETEFYRAIDTDCALDALADFAREHGVRFVGDP
jgi:hypothetical protein